VLHRVAFRHLAFVVFLTLVLDGLEAQADLSAQGLSDSIVTVSVSRDKQSTDVTGLVVQSDPYNGYVLTSTTAVKNNDSLSVTRSDSGARLSAQVIVIDEVSDLALLKVNGLGLSPLSFSVDTPLPGDVVWSAVRWDKAEQAIGLSKGSVRSHDRLHASSAIQVLNHSASIGAGGFGSVLLNDCGEVVGYTSRTTHPDVLSRAIDAPSLMRFIDQRNIKVNLATNPCISQINLARQTAELATNAAQDAKANASEAQRVAQLMANQLQASDKLNQRLVRDAAAAQATADAAVQAAERAQQHAEQTRIDLEKQTASIVAETEAMVAHLQQDRDAAETRFQAALAVQRESATAREQFLIGAFVILIAFLLLAAFVIQRLGIKPAAIVQAVQSRDISVLKPGHAAMHKSALEEYVLDGRDEDGIRYLLRISGDQLNGDDGIIIGRHPVESPYIINHSDVSRQHARLKVMKNRVFIEDLGSTNGTSVNGRNIDDKGLVSVSNGDQIIIGSVVMKLKVISG
jgi:hypothetical protein